MAKRVHSRSTKADIIEAYQELEAAYKQLEDKPARIVVPPPSTALEAVKTPPLSKQPAKKAAPIPVAPDSTMEAVIYALGQLGEKFNTALSQQSTNLLVQASGLKDVRTKVETENKRLASLYGLEIEEDTLSDLLKEYADTAEEYQETLKQKRENADKAWLEKNQAWQIEKEESWQHRQEEDSTDKKTQTREDSKYCYDLTLKRGLSDEEYTQQQQQQQQALDDLEETRRKFWDEREKALGEREQQFQELKIKVERFSNEKETAIKKAKDEGTGIARHQAKIKADLAAKEFAGEQEVYQLKIRSLEDQVADQTAQIDKLSRQLEVALKQAQELAVKAIEGGSSHSSFEALKEIALEQAKNQPKAK